MFTVFCRDMWINDQAPYKINLTVDKLKYIITFYEVYMNDYQKCGEKL